MVSLEWERANQGLKEMMKRSYRLSQAAGGSEGIEGIFARIENLRIGRGGKEIHLDFYRARAPRATIVFQPGIGMYARVYSVLGGVLSREGYHFLAIDRPGHGLSPGEKGGGTVEEDIAVTGEVIEFARHSFRLPVVLLGSSLGGILTFFAVLSGLSPELAIAHNVIYPGWYAGFRGLGEILSRFPNRMVPIKWIANFKQLTVDPVIMDWMTRETDPVIAWKVSWCFLASLIQFWVKQPPEDPAPLVVLAGTRDRMIWPVWSRMAVRSAGLKKVNFQMVPGAGHLLFHDHLDQSIPLLKKVIEENLSP